MVFLFFLSFGCEGTSQESPDEMSKSIKTVQQTTQSKYYTCSMHPTVKQDEPGKCPICNMNLIEAEQEGTKTHVHESSKPHTPSKFQAGDVIGKVKLKKSQLSHFKPEFFPVTKMKMQKNIRLLGSVLASENRESYISARIDGRIEKVYVESTGSFIQVGDPVVDFYSPQLITSGQEYLVARKSYQESPTEDFKGLWPAE